MRIAKCTIFLACVALVWAAFPRAASAQWTQTNGPEGGQIFCFVQDGSLLFAGTEHGVDVSRDNGVRWAESGIPDTTVFALIVAGGNLFAGTTNGVFLSTDNGSTWTSANNGLKPNAAVRSFAENNNGLFAGTDNGMYVSTDYGAQWSPVNNGFPRPEILSVAYIDGYLFAGTVYNGIYRSTNNGAYWYPENTNTNNYLLDSTPVFAFGTLNGKIYAGTGDGMFISSDSGATWTEDLLYQVNAILTNSTDIYAGTTPGGVFHSVDDGASWTPVNTGIPIYNRALITVNAIAESGGNLVAGTDGGVFYSVNLGQNWKTADSGLPFGVMTALAIHDNALFAGTGFDGVFFSTDGGAQWIEANSGLTNYYITALAVSGEYLFAGTNGGVSLSTDGGTSWADVNNGLPFNYDYISALAAAGGSVFAGTNDSGVYYSSDNGANWRAVNNGLTNLTISALAAGGGVVITSTADNRVYVSTNNGANWTAVGGGVFQTPVIALALNNGILYAGSQSGVFYSWNNGASWNATSDPFMMSVIAFAVSGGNIFASTLSGGVFVSQDNGATWITEACCLPNTPSTNAFAVIGKNLFEGTFKFGVWKARGTSSKILSQQTLNFGTLVCDSVRDRTIELYNKGIDTLVISSDQIIGQAGNNFTLINPSSFPVSIAPGDSTPVTVRWIVFNDSTLYGDTLLLYNNDPNPGDNPWAIVLAGAKISIQFSINDGAPRDTIFFPPVACGTAEDTSFILNNLSPIPTTFQFQSTNPEFSSASSVFLNINDSRKIVVHFSGASVAGAYIDSLIISDSCGNPKIVLVKAEVENGKLIFSNLQDTIICAGDSIARFVTIHNLGSTTEILRSADSNSLFAILPDSLVIAAGKSGVLQISFTGTQKSGMYAGAFTFTDNCGNAYIVTDTVTVGSASIASQTILDTTVCPGAMAGKLISLHNFTTTTQTIVLSGGTTLFSVSPDTVTIAPGDSVPVSVIFKGASDTGTYTASYALPACTEIKATVAVHEHTAAVPQLLDTTICPFTPVTLTIPVTNKNGNAQTYLYSINFDAIQPGIWRLLKDSSFIPGGLTDSLRVTFAGGPVGTDSTIVHITGSCGSVDAPVFVHISPPTKLQLSLQADLDTVAVGAEKKVYLIAKPSASAANGVTLHIANEPTALNFDSVSSECGAKVTYTNDTAAITLANCPNAAVSDTIATLYYTTLVGSTLTPTVRLQSATTTNACDSVTGGGTVTLALQAPGCELGTVNVQPFTTSLGAAFPNPATGMTTVTYSTIEDANVTIDIRDALGKTALPVVNTYLKPGVYNATIDARSLKTGVYFLRMQAGEFNRVKELLILH